MKRILHHCLLLVLVLVGACASAQVTITNSTFPEVGDTLRLVTTDSDKGFEREQNGPDQTWDLSGLPNGILVETVYVAPEQGQDAELFPDADLLDNTGNQQIYYQTFNNKIIEIGRSGIDPVLGAIELIFQNEGESVLRRAPMSFGDVFASQSSFSIAAPSSVIPDTLLPGVAQLVDSLRLSVTTENDEVIDGWGTLMLPDGEYEVIRMERTTQTNAVLEVKVPFLGWSVLDEQNPLFGALGALGDLLGAQTTTNYLFFANGNKEVLATISYNQEDELIAVQYKGDISTSIDVIEPQEVDVKTYPNPTYGRVTFELKNMPADDYKVTVYNVIGKELWSSHMDYPTGRLTVDLGHLQKGTYLYSISDGTGRKITTRRLVIVTP